MTREQLEHGLRAAAAIAQETSLVGVRDLAVSKCAAGRDKDSDLVRTLLREGMIDAQTLLARIRQLDPGEPAVQAIAAWAQRRAAEAKTTP